MFRRLTLAIFRLCMKYLVSSYTRLILVVYSGEVGVEVDTRSRMCHGGWEVWVHGISAIICISELMSVRPYEGYNSVTVVNVKLIRMECMYLSNRTLFDGRDMCRIYYIENNYMFRHLTMAIFRLYMK